jgi:hypothetical protein
MMMSQDDGVLLVSNLWTPARWHNSMVSHGSSEDFHH